MKQIVMQRALHLYAKEAAEMAERQIGRSRQGRAVELLKGMLSDMQRDRFDSVVIGALHRREHAEWRGSRLGTVFIASFVDKAPDKSSRQSFQIPE